MKPTLAERLCHISLSIKLAQLSTGPLILNVDVKEAPNKPPKQVRGRGGGLKGGCLGG